MGNSSRKSKHLFSIIINANIYSQQKFKLYITKCFFLSISDSHSICFIILPFKIRKNQKIRKNLLMDMQNTIIYSIFCENISTMNSGGFEISCTMRLALNHIHKLISLTDPHLQDYHIVDAHSRHHLDHKVVEGGRGLLLISEPLSCIHLHHLPHSRL